MSQLKIGIGSELPAISNQPLDNEDHNGEDFGIRTKTSVLNFKTL